MREGAAEPVARDESFMGKWGRRKIISPAHLTKTWDRNPGFLKSEIGPFSDFKKKSYLMDLKSAQARSTDS